MFQILLVILEPWWHMHALILYDDDDALIISITAVKNDEQRRGWAELIGWWWIALMWQWAHLTVICVCDEYVETVSCNCKSKLVLLLRLGYLKPFLAGSKKTRQGPVFRVGALHISRCWFYLMVVAGTKLIQKDYKIIWCCVLLCYGFWWFKCLWYVNDEVKDVYEVIMKLVE